MNFQLTPEQQALRRSVREFAEAEVKPHIMDWDEAQNLPDEIIRKVAELGLFGIIFPEDLGGSGMGYIEYAIAVEELARVDPSVALLVAAQISLCTNHIYIMGSDQQRRKYVSKLSTGEWIGCWSLTRAPGRLRRRRHALPCRKEGRPLAVERLENLYNQRPHC